MWRKNILIRRNGKCENLEVPISSVSLRKTASKWGWNRVSRSLVWKGVTEAWSCRASKARVKTLNFILSIRKSHQKILSRAVTCSDLYCLKEEPGCWVMENCQGDKSGKGEISYICGRSIEKSRVLAMEKKRRDGGHSWDIHSSSLVQSSCRGSAANPYQPQQPLSPGHAPTESNGALDANVTLTEKVAGRWTALWALLSLLEGIIIMLKLEKAVKKQYIAFRKLTLRNCLYFIGLSHISSFLCSWWHSVDDIFIFFSFCSCP